MVKYFMFLIFPLFASCYVSSFNRPGIQMNTKGVLKNVQDTIYVIQVLSFSASFEDNVNWRRFGIKNNVEEKIKLKLYQFLNDYLTEKKIHFSFKEIDSALIRLPDSIIYKIDSSTNFISASERFFKIGHSHKKILIMRFHYNTDTHLGYSTLGPAGQTYTRYEIKSNAIVLEEGKVLYRRSNMASLPFVEDFFYRRAVSRVLDDAFK